MCAINSSSFWICAVIDFIVEFFRLVLWELCKALLTLMDVSYSLMKEIGLMEIFSLDAIWKMWSGVMIFITFFVVIRIAKIAIVTLNDSEKIQKFSVISVLQKMFITLLIITFIPFGMKAVGSIGAWSIDNFTAIIGMSNDELPSTVVVNSYSNASSGSWDESGNFIPGVEVTYTMKDIEINAFNEGAKTYKFFPEISDLFTILIIGFTAAIIMIMVAVDFGKRVHEQVLALMVTPITISSVISDSYDTFFSWLKGFISLYLTNFYQLLIVILALTMSSFSIIKEAGWWIQIVLLVSGLLVALAGSASIAKYIGGDTSSGGSLQQMASLRMATSGMGRGIGGMARGVGNIGRKLGGTALSAGAGAAYGAGRALGGNSFKDLGANSFSSAARNDNNPANNFKSYADSMPRGTKAGFAARTTSAGSGHVYKAASKRYNNSKLGKGSTDIAKKATDIKRSVGKNF